jgi:aminoglycoside phosphotransferase family enzyme/predicted kinase
MATNGLTVQELLSPDCYPHPADNVQLIETHISWVLLAGDFAYKLKKPVDLGFLDFTSRSERERFCHEELRLNRRLAPKLYLDVVPLRRSGGKLRFGGDGEIVEHAVRMRRFDQEAQLDRRLESRRLTEADIDAVAVLVGRFHESAPVADAESAWGRPETVIVPVRENFAHLGPAIDCGRRASVVERLRRWSESRFPELRKALLRRLDSGRIRECHGDLHLRNMAMVDGQVIAFDGIEFDPALRWIDVISDCAFLIMDLESRGRRDFAWRFLNRWLEITGDYAGLALLAWYLVYRHMVRAKVDAIRLGQTDLPESEAQRLRRRIDSHLALALEATEPGHPVALMTSGVSGSGKSWLADRLSQSLPGIWIRSDVERKRLFGMDAHDRPDPARIDEIYSADTTRRVYGKMTEHAAGLLEAGYSVILDATFLEHAQRKRAAARLGGGGLPVLILSCEAEVDTLHRRVARRERADADASDAGPRVLERQLSQDRSFADDEAVIVVRTDTDIDIGVLVSRIQRRPGKAGG